MLPSLFYGDKYMFGHEFCDERYNVKDISGIDESFMRCRNVLQIRDLIERFHCTVLICNMAQKRNIDKSKSIIEWQDIGQTSNQTISQIILVFVKCIYQLHNQIYMI